MAANTPPNVSSAQRQQRRKILREKFRARRRGLSADERRQACGAILINLQRFTQDLADQQQKQPLAIAAYLAADGEADLADWLTTSLHWVYLPRINARAKTMHFHRWQGHEPLYENQFGIGEPAADAPQLPAAELDLVLTPLVAFDTSGTRLGMGGGYYDRCFADIPSATMVGVAFQCQQSPTFIPSEPWDRRLNAVVTEQGVLEWPAV